MSPLPDAKPDKRIYQLLKTTDLANLTFSDFQKVAETIYAEQGAEDELRRIVLINLARLSVAGEWNGLTSSGSSGMTSFDITGDSGSAQTVTNGNTVTVAGGTGISSVASATDTVTVNLDDTAVTPGSYTRASVTIDQQGRVTAASSGSTPTDTTYDLKAAASGSDAEIQLDASAGTDSAVKLAAGTNVTLTESGGDTITIAASGGSGSSPTFSPVLVGKEPTSDLSLFMVSSMGLQNAVSGGFGTYGMSATPACWPFQAPKDGNIDHISLDITNDGSGTLKCAIYSDDEGLPNAKLSGDMTYVAGTSGTGRLDLTPPTTTTLEKGKQYWFMITESPSGTMTVRSRAITSDHAVLPISKTSSNLLVSLPHYLNVTSSSGVLPATVNTANLTGNTSDSNPVWGIVYA